MNGPWHVIGWGETIATGVAALALAAAGPAAAQAQMDEASIAVFADHYVLAGRSIDDVNVLDSALRATPGLSVRLNHCESGSARALKAAVHHLRARPIDIRVPATDAPACADSAPSMRRVAESTGPRPLGINDAAVEEYWSQIMP